MFKIIKTSKKAYSKVRKSLKSKARIMSKKKKALIRKKKQIQEKIIILKAKPIELRNKLDPMNQ